MGFPVAMFTVLFALGRHPAGSPTGTNCSATPTRRSPRPRQWYTGEGERDYVKVGALARSAWDVMVRPMRWSVALLAAFGLATMLACDSSAPMVLAHRVARVRDGLLRPKSTVGIIVRG